MPAWFMIEPAQMKNGTASSGNESVDLHELLHEDAQRQAVGEEEERQRRDGDGERDRHVEREQHEHQQRGQVLHGAEQRRGRHRATRRPRPASEPGRAAGRASGARRTRR